MQEEASTTEPKTLIAVLASHDRNASNEKLARVLDELCDSDERKARLGNFRFVFTGGTFDRVLTNTRGADEKGHFHPVSDDTRDFLLPNTIRLPDRAEGGVTVLSYLIVRRQCSIVWPFLTPVTPHWLNPENLALMRLCDIWHVKRAMNSGSVREWFGREANRDTNRNLQPWPPTLVLGGNGRCKHQTELKAIRRKEGGFEFEKPANTPCPDKPEPESMSVALIAHDEMKTRMVEFAMDYESQLSKFQRILATGTTARQVADAAPTLAEKIDAYNSGPKGGDIEIATEILFGGCHVVIFFVDPLHPHPHIEDIRVVFGACMIQDEVRMLTNEMQAREWMDRVVAGR